MINHPSHKYFRGRVRQYDRERGRGLIWPDEGQDIFGQLLLRRKSLRDPKVEIAANDRVLFSIEVADRGILATDVHSERIQDTDEVDLSERLGGTIRDFKEDRGFGFIRLVNGLDAFFHFTYLSDPTAIPIAGSRVTCRVVNTEKGVQAQDIIIDSP